MTDFKEIKRILTIDYISGNSDNELFLLFDQIISAYEWAKSTLNDTDYFTINVDYLPENVESHYYLLYYDVTSNVVWFDRLSFRSLYNRLTVDVTYNSGNYTRFGEEYQDILTIIIQNYLSTKFVEKFPEFRETIQTVKVCQSIKYQRQPSLIDKTLLHYHGSNNKTT